jgi:glutamine synthetase
MPASMLVFAPHGNSYERLVPDAHAPTCISWGFENRTTAIRVPAGSHKARRIEHRVAGGDINPYLMLAVVLGAAIIGIEDKLTPPDPVKGNAGRLDLLQLPTQWHDAIDTFAQSDLIDRILPRGLKRNFELTKRQELQIFNEMTPDERIDLYLDTV